MIAGNTREDGTNCTPAGCLVQPPRRPQGRLHECDLPPRRHYAINDDYRVYASAARGYRAPDTSELYRLQRQQSIADLDAGTYRQLELGARGDIGPLGYSLAVFAMKKDNVIFRDSNAFNVSDGRTEHEASNTSSAGRRSMCLSISAAGTYAEHTYDFNRGVEEGETIVAGRDIDTAPRHVNTARIDWQFLPAANVELEWVSVGRYCVDARQCERIRGSRPPEPARRLAMSDSLDDDIADQQPHRSRLRRSCGLRVRQLPLLPGSRTHVFFEVRYSAHSAKRACEGSVLSRPSHSEVSRE